MSLFDFFLKTIFENSCLEHIEHNYGVLKKLFLFLKFSVLNIFCVFQKKKKDIRTKHALYFLKFMSFENC